MSDHTQGPWEVYYSQVGHAPWVRAKTGEHITSIDSDREDEIEGNARLVAEAPRMLAALKAIANGLGKELTAEQVLEIAWATIAKAEGKQ